MTYKDKTSYESSPPCNTRGNTSCNRDPCKRDMLQWSICVYWVASISRLLKIIGLFLQKSPVKETMLCKRDRGMPDRCFK